MIANQPKLPFGHIALYSMASLGLNILGITIGTWILYFYAPPPDSGRTAYIPAALFGVLMMVASLWDAAIDPFIGHWSDTLRSRWGRRRPFLMFAAPFVLFGAILIWTPPGAVGRALDTEAHDTVTLIWRKNDRVALLTAHCAVSGAVQHEKRRRGRRLEQLWLPK